MTHDSLLQKSELWVDGPDATAAAREFIERVGDKAGLSGERLNDAVMAAGEAVANAIEWGSPCYGGTLHLRVERDGDRIAFYVCDCGRFEEEQALSMEMPDPLTERGRGLPLIGALMDDVEVLRDENKTTIKMVKLVREPATAARHN